MSKVLQLFDKLNHSIANIIAHLIVEIIHLIQIDPSQLREFTQFLHQKLQFLISLQYFFIMSQSKLDQHILAQAIQEFVDSKWAICLHTKP